MKIEVEITVEEDGRYGSQLARRKISLEAERLPSEVGNLVGNIVNQTIAEAEDKEAKRKLTEATEPFDVPPSAPPSFNADADMPL